MVPGFLLFIAMIAVIVSLFFSINTGWRGTLLGLLAFVCITIRQRAIKNIPPIILETILSFSDLSRIKRKSAWKKFLTPYDKLSEYKREN